MSLLGLKTGGRQRMSNPREGLKAVAPFLVHGFSIPGRQRSASGGFFVLNGPRGLGE